MAIRQELAGPKSGLIAVMEAFLETKGNQVKIPELEILGS